MGGSGGRSFRNYSQDRIRSLVDQEGNETRRAEHNSDVNAALTDLLAQYNDRPVEKIRERLDTIQEAIQDDLDTIVDLRFGGSVAKHTDVDGLSDVDALVILRDDELATDTAYQVLEAFADALRRELPYQVDVGVGKLAVTVTFPDEMEIQLLPAIRTATGLRIPAANSEDWSSVIRPEVFAAKLTERNQQNGNRVVPTVKLAKAALEQIPENLRPSGYHVESLAVESFKNYSGPNNLKEMLRHFFERASDLVLQPMRDSTGQSLNVDSYLGPANSKERQSLGGIMSRISRRMANADKASSFEDWLAAIGE